MQQFKLPDGRYINPALIHRFQIAKHFFRSKFYVQVHLSDGRIQDVAENLSQDDAKVIKQQSEQKLESLHADISAYTAGLEAGVEEGTTKGYESGFTAGRRQGHDAGLQEGRLGKH